MMKNLFKINFIEGRVYGLDILRAFAILFVVISHAVLVLPKQLRNYINYFIFDGVTIFFVLSGFLIGGILIKTLNNNKVTKKLLLNFWIRRWFRTIPNYLFVLIISLILNFLYKNSIPENIFKYFIFSQNLFYSHPKFFPEAWSLSVEEWFYLTIPLIIIFLSFLFKNKKKSIINTCFLIITLVTLFRFIRYFNLGIIDFDTWDSGFRKQVITRLDSLMFGFFGAYINFYYYSYWIKTKKTFFIAGILIFIVLKFLENKEGNLFNCVFSFTLYSFATLLLLPFLNNYKKEKGLVFKSITYVSVISYSMYLINLTIVENLIIFKIPLREYTKNLYFICTFRFLSFWILLFPLSIIIYKYIEVPTTRLRENQKIKKLIDKI